MSQTHVFHGLTMKSATSRGNSLMEASSRDGYAVEQRNRRPSVKPVNVAGCREWSTSSRRRFRRSAPREYDEMRRGSAHDDCFSGDSEREERPSAELVHSHAAVEAPAPASVTTRITRRLKEMKQASFLNCVSLTLSSTAKAKDTTTISPNSQSKHGHSKFRQRKKSTMSNGSDNLDGEPSLRIPALFPEPPTETRRKIILRESLTKLKRTMFKSRSTTPTNFDGIPDRRMNRTTSPSIYSSGARRNRRQENLVKMMEKKLEDRGDEREEDMSSPPPEAVVFATSTSSPLPDERKARQNRNRKIKARRHRSRKIVHRRTVTC